MRDFALTISKILKDYNLTTDEITRKIKLHLFKNVYNLSPEDEEDLFELMLDSTELATIVVLFCNRVSYSLIERYINCLSGENFLDDLKNRSNITEYSKYIVYKLKGKECDTTEEIKYNKLKVRETITNVTLADEYMENSMNFLYLFEDLDQMRNLHKSLKNIDNMYPSADNFKRFYEIDSKTMKMVYDSVTLILDIKETDLKHLVLDNIDKLYDRCLSEWCKDIGCLYDVIAKGCDEHQAITDTVHALLNSLEYDTDLMSTDAFHKLTDTVTCVSEIIWHNILKDYVHEIAVTLDEEDFVIFIYYMFQITRYNYNTPVHD